MTIAIKTEWITPRQGIVEDVFMKHEGMIYDLAHVAIHVQLNKFRYHLADGKIGVMRPDGAKYIIRTAVITENEF